jgi:hypothetical protein
MRTALNWLGIVVLEIDAIKALVISSFAYREDSSTQLPKNMPMIFGKYDEFRKRMTATRDFEKEWMGIFLHSQLRRPLKSNWRLTFINWSAFSILVLVIPLVLLLIFQYLPLFTIDHRLNPSRRPRRHVHRLYP